jgi:hypothetical protein
VKKLTHNYLPSRGLKAILALFLLLLASLMPLQAQEYSDDLDIKIDTVIFYKSHSADTILCVITLNSTYKGKANEDVPAEGITDYKIGKKAIEAYFKEQRIENHHQAKIGSSTLETFRLDLKELVMDTKQKYEESNLKWQSNLEFRARVINSTNFAQFGILPWHFHNDKTRRMIFSADLDPHFFLFTENLNLRWILDFNPRIYTRIRKEEISSPVRTPSFNIGTTAYFKLNKPQKTHKDFHMLTASYYHHSNGQDQPLLKDSLKNPILVKGAPYVYKPAHVVNNYNGDFYTNYIKFGYIHIHSQKLDNDERHKYSKFMAGITRKLSCLLNMEESNRLTYHYRYERMIKWGLDLEAHPNLLAEKEWNSQFWSANFALKNRYGYLRLNGLFDLIDITESKDEINGFTTEVRHSELYRLQVRSSVILNSLSELVNYRWYKRVYSHEF